MQDIILLHGALGSEAQLLPLKKILLQSFTVHTLNFSGHGGAAMPEHFSIEHFASDVLEYMAKSQINSAHFFGYSMGGYVALYLAAKHPSRIGKIVTLATKFDWTPEIAAKEIRMLDPEKIADKIPAFAKSLQVRHDPNDWKEVLKMTAAMMAEMGNNPPLLAMHFKSIQNCVLLCLGENDAMVSAKETKFVLSQLPNAKFLLLAATEHPIEKAGPHALSEIITNFIL